jgi:D-alanyl-D-alanine carboxypeptidase
MKRLFKLFLFLFCFPFISNGQSIPPSIANALQGKIDSFRVSNNLKGISAAVFIPQMGTWKGISGISHAGNPITTEMVFGIASQTKLFTGVLLLKLAENNLIHLGDSLHKFLPTYNNIDSNITIRQLLNHTSGLDDVTSVPGYPDSMMNNPNRIFTATELLRWAGPPNFSPGTGWSYCNTNYLIAGLIAESVTGRSFHELIRDSILTPLSLDSTYLDVYERFPLSKAHPWQAGFNNNGIPRTSVNSAAWAAGGMYSNASEMIQWYHALLNRRIINASSINEMTTFVGSGRYGIGISQNTVSGRTVWTHGGNIWGGYNSSMIYDTATGIIVCVLINQIPAQSNILASQLLTSVVNLGVSSKDFLEEVQELIIYPNPTHDKFMVKCSPSEKLKIKIFDGWGNIILETDNPSINLESYPSGIYGIEVNSSSKCWMKKIVKY